MNTAPVTDTELRAMRDAVYAPVLPTQIQCDESWELVKAAWRKDEAWLKEQVVKSGSSVASPHPKT